MRDEDFEGFIEEFGEATYHQAVPQEAIDQWRGKLPDKLLHYWQTEGWNGYAHGRFWIVNPDDYEDIVDEWLEGSPLEQVDSFHVIARTAFGKIYLCGEKAGCEVKIECGLHGIFVMDLEPKERSIWERELPWFFSSRSPDEVDFNDVHGEPLFNRALASLGPLAPDEMYGFEPALVLGGKITLDRLRKVKIDQHLTILRQLAAPTMPFGNIDIQKLLKS
ncbi:DUF1851 domain-containing protein [Mitsuaria sp. WAJ17]|uniref:GAD-like domain-containing protein n=1 Tax=Mitsuaria sp. WAJ17 TaxID=2761452 RepID=UPI0016002E78|nr:GAD-like domain-containing protein [Mitsuaria sp. WAJ17]MBB2488148.1 DUF1851 domain-containing protein [Mitsuaria sp. WAJ17]